MTTEEEFQMKVAKAKLFFSKIALAGIALVSSFSAFAQSKPSKPEYKTDLANLCDGFPKISVGTPEGLCVGLIASPKNGLKMPRYAVQDSSGVIYVTDMGGWAFGKGTVYAIYQTKNGNGENQIFVKDLFPTNRLTTPNGIAIDPEGRVYIGTSTGLIRFKPRNHKTGEFNIDPKTTVIFNDFAKWNFREKEYANAKAYSSLEPKLKNKHPLIQIAANRDFTKLFINIGAPSDNCGSGIETIDKNGACLQSDGKTPHAAVWKLALSTKIEEDEETEGSAPSRKVIAATPYAKGLRNSMALTVHPQSELVIQGENSMDLPDEEAPYEELNVLKEGNHYGWPYCYGKLSDDKQKAEIAISPLFTKSLLGGNICDTKFSRPQIFMPAHTAPLGLLYYQGNQIPELEGKLLVSWHGYRKYGHRVVAYNTDKNGVPMNELDKNGSPLPPKEIIYDWDPIAEVRPLGAPTGVLQLKDGSVLVLDDKNGAVLRLSKGDRAARVVQTTQKQFSDETLKAFAPLVPFVKTNCAMCHTPFQKVTDKEILNEMSNSMLNFANPTESSFFTKLKARQMPPMKLQDHEYSDIQPHLDAFINSLK